MRVHDAKGGKVGARISHRTFCLQGLFYRTYDFALSLNGKPLVVLKYENIAILCVVLFTGLLHSAGTILQTPNGTRGNSRGAPCGADVRHGHLFPWMCIH